MKYTLGKKEAEHKFEVIERLIEQKKEFNLKTENIMYMITEVVLSGLEQPTTTNEVEHEEVKELIEKGTTKFDKRFELIGQMAKKTHALSQYVKNPYKIRIDRYDRCKRCGKVGIASLTVNRESNPKRTSIYAVWKHEKGNQHSVTIESFEGEKLSWEEIVERAGQGTKAKEYKRNLKGGD